MEEDNYFEVSSRSLDTVSPPHLPISSNSQFPDHTTQPSLMNKPKLRPPLPPPKSSPSRGYDGTSLYEDPNLVHLPDQYSFAEQVDDVYDSIISDTVLQKLNLQPPPVWKNPANSVPPPLPPNRQSKRFTKILESEVISSFDETQFDFPSGPPPPLPDRSLRDESPNLRPPMNNISSRLSPLLTRTKKLQPPPPPVKNRANTPPAMPFAVNFKSDLGSKLKQRRQVSRSWSEDEQGPYEDIEYPPRSPVHNRELSKSAARERLMSEEESLESDTDSYVDCDPNSPQAYLDYNHSSREKSLPLPLPPRHVDRLPVPLPPPSQTNTAPPLLSSDDESAPPVPRRHPQASGRSLHQTTTTPNKPRSYPHIVNNPIPLPPRSKSPMNYADDDEVPPVPPIRGPESTRPPLSRPHSENKTNSLPSHTPQRGISVPAGGTRLPLPPPKIALGYHETKNDDLFEDVSFNKKSDIHKQSSPVPKQPKQNITHVQPSWKRSEIATEDVSSRPPVPIPKSTKREISMENVSSRPPVPIPKSAKREISPKPIPLRKPNNMSHKPKATSPPPIANRPKVNSSSLDNLLSIDSPQNSRKKLPGPPVSPGGMRKKWQEPHLNGTETAVKKQSAPDVRRDIDAVLKRKPTSPVSPSVRKKLPEPSFLNSKPKPSEIPRTQPVKNPGMRKTLPDPPVSNMYNPEPKRIFPSGPETARKPSEIRNFNHGAPNGPETARKPSEIRNFNYGAPNGPETARKPPPPTPKAKPAVLSKIQNSELAACLQNNNPSLSRHGGASSSSQRPVVALKPKPMLPPR